MRLPALPLSLLSLSLLAHSSCAVEDMAAMGGERADERDGEYPAELRAQWEASPFELVSHLELSPPEGIVPRAQVELEVVVIQDPDESAEGPRWTLQEAAARYQDVVDVYAECGLVFSPLRIVEVAPPHDDLVSLFNTTTPDVRSHIEYEENLANEQRDNNTDAVAAMLPRTAELQNVHIRTFIPQGSSLAGAFYHLGGDPFFFEEDHPLVYRSWLLGDILSESYKAGVPEGYSTEAHELGHILLNSGHRTEGENNIMGFPAEMLGTRFDAQQCETILSSPLVTPLD